MGTLQVSQVRVHAFGRTCHIIVDNTDGRGEEYLSLCKAELLRLERKFSAFDPDSIISRLNQCAGTGSFVATDGETNSLFDFTNALWSESKHVFDPTTRILDNCYDSDGRLRASREQVNGILKLVGLQHLQRSDAGVHLARKGMVMDLNSCVRPYAVDCLRKLLCKHEARHALIEMDADIATIGKQQGGANWLVGIRLPQGTRATITRLKLNDRCFAMRGNFERATIEDGERYGRALSPIDGQPIPGLLGVGVTADSCLEACSAASIARLKTEAAGLKWLDSLGLPWVAIGRDLRCHGPLAPWS